MKPGGIGRFKPPTPVYRPCALCGRKHRIRPDGTSKTGEVITEDKVVMTLTDPGYIRVPAGAVICFLGCLTVQTRKAIRRYCQSRSKP